MCYVCLYSSDCVMGHVLPLTVLFTHNITYVFCYCGLQSLFEGRITPPLATALCSDDGAATVRTQLPNSAACLSTERLNVYERFFCITPA